MISVYQLKGKFQQLLTPVLLFLHRRKITANQITLASVLLSVAIGILFWNADAHPWMFLSLPAGLLLRMALNALDGMMARKFAQTSKLGEVLNEVGDVVSDVVVFFPLLKFQPENGYGVVAFIVLSVVNEFAGLLGKAIGATRRYDGPMGKSDRALLLGIYGIVLFAGGTVSAYSGFILGSLCLLLLLSSFIRLKKALYEVRG